MRLELLHRLLRVVDERESRALAATVLGPEAEDLDRILVRLVELGQFGAEFVFGDVGAVGVEDVTKSVNPMSAFIPTFMANAVL